MAPAATFRPTMSMMTPRVAIGPIVSLPSGGAESGDDVGGVVVVVEPAVARVRSDVARPSTWVAIWKVKFSANRSS